MKQTDRQQEHRPTANPVATSDSQQTANRFAPITTANGGGNLRPSDGQQGHRGTTGQRPTQTTNRGKGTRPTANPVATSDGQQTANRGTGVQQPTANPNGQQRQRNTANGQPGCNLRQPTDDQQVCTHHNRQRGGDLRPSDDQTGAKGYNSQRPTQTANRGKGTRPTANPVATSDGQQTAQGTTGRHRPHRGATGQTNPQRGTRFTRSAHVIHVIENHRNHKFITPSRYATLKKLGIMNTRVYFLSFSLGLGLGTTTMHTSNPFGEVMQLAAAGHLLEHVTIKSSSSDSAAAEQQQTEQGWQFLEWS